MADVEFRNENGVLWITLNRPEQMGALTSEMRDQIVDQIWAARDDTAVRALVITGKGTARDGGGVLRSAVPRWITEGRFRSCLVGISAADRRHGGDGAVYVMLRRQ